MVAILLQPAGEGAFLHRPAETRNCDFDRHGAGSYSFTNSRIAAAIVPAFGIMAASRVGL